MDAMRGDATLFTRDDEVEAQWRILDPILQAWGQDDRPAAAVPGRLARPRGGELDPRGRAPVADDLSADGTFMDGVWSAQDTTPVRHRRRSARAPQAAPRRGRGDRARAGAQPRGDRRPRVARRDPEPAGARGPLPPLAAHPLLGRARADDSSTRGSPRGWRVTGDPASSRSTTRRCWSRWARATSRKMDTIVDPLVVSDLATVVWAPHRHTEAVDSLLRLAQVVLVDSEQWPDPAFAAQRAARARRPGPTSWTSPGCARHPGASGWRRPSIPRSGGGSCPRSARSPPATAPSRSITGVLFFGWLASRLGWEAGSIMDRSGTLFGRCHGRRQDVELTLEPDITMTSPGLAGVTIETALGTEIDLNRGPGGLSARRRTQGRPRVDLDGARRLARRGRHPRRGHPAGASARPHLRSRPRTCAARCCK